MGPIDRSLKLLCGHFPDELLALLLPERTPEILEALDKELPATTHLADKAWRVAADHDEWIVHVEFAVHVRDATWLALFSTAVRLHAAYELGVHSVLLALSEPDAARPLPDGYGWAAGGVERCRYAVDTLRLWTYDAGEALESDSPVAWVLATHMRGGDSQAALERAAARIRGLEDQPPRVRADLLGILRVLGERRLGDAARAIVTKEMIMGSTLYDEIFSDGWDRGIAKGRAEGQKVLLLHLIRSRFGDVPEGMKARIEGINDSAALERLADRVLTARSLDELWSDR